MAQTLLVTCEHAGNLIPDGFADCFQHAGETLISHEGWDPGAWPIATALARELGAPLYGCHISRLLVEVNRSLHHPQLFSRYTHQLDQAEKQRVINEWYLPYRNQVENEINRSPKPVLHLSIHTFTPIFNGVKREVEIGLLFDPARKYESQFCQDYLNALLPVPPAHNIQFNQPYLGVDDGFTTYLRSRFEDAAYAGIEIEISQKLASRPAEIAQKLLAGLKK